MMIDDHILKLDWQEKRRNLMALPAFKHPSIDSNMEDSWGKCQDKLNASPSGKGERGNAFAQKDEVKRYSQNMREKREERRGGGSGVFKSSCVFSF